MSAGELVSYHTTVLAHKVVYLGKPEEVARGFEQVRNTRGGTEIFGFHGHVAIWTRSGL